MKSRFFGFFLFLGISISGWAQVPQIGNVEKLSAYPSTSLLITGSGFSDTPAQLQVWFGNVKGVITESTGSAIRVTVPAQARLSSIEVINLASKRSAKSKNLFMPNFSGAQPFTPNFRRKQFNSTEGVFDLCTCDLDNDGDTDIIGSKNTNSLMLLTNTSTVLADSTVINFTTSSVTIGFPTWSLTCGDLNGDGKPEVVATRGGSNATQIFIFPNNTTTANTIVFGPVVTLDLVSGDQAKEVAIHDLNKDGRSEIIVTNASLSNNKIYIFENLLSSASIVANEFNRISKSVNTATSTLALEVQDYNGDGWSDIAVIQGNNSVNAYIVPNPANGTLDFTATFQTVGVSGSNLSDLASADFDKDGKIDFVATDRQSGGGRAFVMLNRSTATTFIFSAVSGTFSTAVAHGVDVADMNGDGFADFVVASRELSGSPQVDVYINNGLSTVGFDKHTYVPPYDAWFVKAGDYDGDSKPDIAITVTDNTNFGIHVLRNRNCHKPVIQNDNPISICDGQTIALNAVNVKGVTFSWERNGVPVGTGPTLNITNAVAAGTYVVKATGENASPQKCLSIPSASLTVTGGTGSAPSTPVITLPNGVCVGAALTLQTNTVAGATYLWSGPNNYTASTSTPSSLVIGSATTTQKGSYYLKVKVGDCTSNSSAAKFVDVITPAAFSISSNAGAAGVCAGQPVTLSVNPDASYNYQWKRNGSNLSGQTGSSYAIASATGTDEANYTVLVSHQTITCSSETNAFSLAVFSAPVSSFTTSPPQVCVGTQVTFNSSGSTVDNTATVNYAWAFGDTGVGTGTSPTHIYTTASASVNVSLTINYTGVTGCSSISNLAFAVSAATQPTIVLDPVVTEICSDGSETVTLTVPEIFTSYVWSTSQTGPTISVDEPGTYTVETINAGGCEGTAQIELLAKSGCEPVEIKITAPKVFTPNNDSYNDYWKIDGIETSDPNCELNFFDGRGRRVLTIKASAFPIQGWDGKSGGTDLPDGTYYYVFGCPTGKPATGSVLIVR